MDGQYIGGIYQTPAVNLEYNRRVSLFNMARNLRGIGSEVEVEEIITDANKIEKFLLGNDSF